MVFALVKRAGNTVEITTSVPWSEIEPTYTKIVESLLNEIELPGFRKGKAPRELAIKQIQNTKVFEEVLKEKVPGIYSQAVKDLDLKPIISPKVEVLEAEEGKEWKLKMQTCEKPDVDLSNYKEELAKLKSSKARKIWLPGEKKEDDKKKDEVTLTELLETIYKSVKVDLSELLIESELNRLLSNLVNELQKLGLTVEQYIQSQQKTSDGLRQEYSDQAKKTLTLEFVLENIAEKENITVEEAEIQEFINKAKTDAEKKQLENEKYYIGSLLRRQKTISHLLSPSIVKV